MKTRKKGEIDFMAELISLSSVLFENMSKIQREQLQKLQVKLDQLYMSKAKGAFTQGPSGSNISYFSS